MQRARLAAAIWCLCSFACAGAIVAPAVPPGRLATDALLVLPGFGYGRAGEQAFRALAPAMAADGIDLYLPTFVARGGLDDSRAQLGRYIREHHLARYERVHVFAFIAGGWTFNPLVETGILPNLASVVYDRSPYQERAPQVAREKLPLLTWLRYGPVVFDVARTDYIPLVAPSVRVGLLIETEPTGFIKRYAAAAQRQGPYQFVCDAFHQRYDDCLYVAMDHHALYGRFGEVWPEVQSFVDTGRFTTSANRRAQIAGAH